MPFSTLRSSARGTPRGLLGKSGSMINHSKSLSSYRRGVLIKAPPKNLESPRALSLPMRVARIVGASLALIRQSLEDWTGEYLARQARPDFCSHSAGVRGALGQPIQGLHRLAVVE